MKCNGCGREIAPSAKFCEYCGKPVMKHNNYTKRNDISAKILRCSNCGARLEPDDKFCAVCGTPVSAGREVYKKKNPRIFGVILISVIIILLLVIAAIAAYFLISKKNSSNLSENSEQSTISSEELGTEDTSGADVTSESATVPYLEQTEQHIHTTELQNVLAATCTTDGYSGDQVCTTCGTVVEKGEVIPATGHNYQNGVCTICGEKNPETQTTLATPVISSVANSKKGVTVKWNVVTGASSYRVYYKGGSMNNWTSAGDTTSTSYTVTGLTSGTSYSFTVQCISPSASSYDTTGKSIKFLTAGKIKSLTNTAKGVKIKWKKVAGASGYYVCRKASGGSWKKIKTIKKNGTTSYIDTKVKKKNGKAYTYAIKPYSGKTKGAYVSAKTVRLTGTSISSVKNVKGKKLKVKWKKGSKITGYQIQYSVKSNFSSAKTVTVKKKGTTSATISKLKKGKKYYVRIRTYKTASGKKYYSAWSKRKSVKISK